VGAERGEFDARLDCPAADLFGMTIEPRRAEDMRAFRLMTLEPELTPQLKAAWAFTVADRERRMVAFRDERVGTLQ